MFGTIRRWVFGQKPTTKRPVHGAGWETVSPGMPTLPQSDQLRALFADVDRARAAGQQIDDPAARLVNFLETIRRQADGDDIRAFCAGGYFDLASAYREMGRTADAEANYAVAQSLFSSLLETQHEQFAWSRLAASKNQLGMLYMDGYLQGEPLQKAIPPLDAAINMRRQLADRWPADKQNIVYLAGALCNRAHVARECNDLAVAADLYAESIRIIDAAVPPCTCGCRDAVASSVSEAQGSPHWVMVAAQFRSNAEEGQRATNALLANGPSTIQ
jgi:tetratricopeptide (TPR) repeat protein